MVLEPVLLNSTPALVGAVIGGGASLAAAVYTQWYQDRRQRIAREAEKREAIYGEFIMSASKVLVSAYISDKLSWTGDEQHLIGLIKSNAALCAAPNRGRDPKTCTVAAGDEKISPSVFQGSSPRKRASRLSTSASMAGSSA